MTINIKELQYHIALTSSVDMRSILRPLTELLGTDYFTFSRIFSDHTLFRLTTCPEWSERYIKHNYFQLFRTDQYPPTTNSYEYVLWDHYLQQADIKQQTLSTFQEASTEFGMYHAFTVIHQGKGYFDVFTFGVMKDHQLFNYATYLREIEVIEKFLTFFLRRAQPILDKATKQRFATFSSGLILNDTTVKIFDQIPAKSSPHLSKRETQCLSQVLQGQSAKKIAIDMHISPRTVEFYIESLKKKLACSSRYEILAKYSNLSTSQNFKLF